MEGIRVEPPTSTISLMSLALSFESFSAFSDWSPASGDELAGELLELGTRQTLLDVLGTRGIGGDEREGDLGLLHTRELNLGLLRSLGKTLQPLPVLQEVDSLGLLEIFYQPVHDDLVKVVATKVGVAVGGEHFTNSVTDLQHGDIEGPSTEVEHQNRLVVGLFQPICQRCGSGLVDNSQHV